jgi:serine/threonine-protein kinase
MSAVYMAQRAGKTVVVKESVVPSLTDETMRSKARELFNREAQLLMKLDHPRIAKIYDHFVEDRRDYLVLDYVPGKTLREYVLAEGPQSEEKVLDITRQVLEILTYLHGQDPPIVHRDLTPDNLMMAPDGRVFVIDFGAANQFIGAATGTLIGKQLYIAPEQFRGKAEPASDIYALGVTLHYLLTGKEPDALSVSHPRNHRSELSHEIDDFVASLTQMESSQRLGPAAAIIDRLSHLKEGGSSCVIDDSGATISLDSSELAAVALEK